MLAVVERDRQMMIDQANAAETPRQIKASSEALYSWLAEHPDDMVVINKIGPDRDKSLGREKGTTIPALKAL
jgi:hypothetical protein